MQHFTSNGRAGGAYVEHIMSNHGTPRMITNLTSPGKLSPRNFPIPNPPRLSPRQDAMGKMASGRTWNHEIAPSSSDGPVGGGGDGFGAGRLMHIQLPAAPPAEAGEFPNYREFQQRLSRGQGSGGGGGGGAATRANKTTLI